MNNKWECYKCGFEDNFENMPSGYLANYHPLCLNCANDIYYDNENVDRFRLTFHIEQGDLFFFENLLHPISNLKLN